MRKSIKVAITLIVSLLIMSMLLLLVFTKLNKDDNNVIIPVEETKSTQEFINTETNYHKYWWDCKEDLQTNLEKARALGVGTLDGQLYTGHKVYLDKDGKPFIISGEVPVYLESSEKDSWKLPETSKTSLRMEETGQVMKHYKDPAEQQKEFQEADGNVIINSYKKVDIKELIKDNIYYWEAEKICKETGITYTEEKNSIILQYETASKKILNYEIQIDNKKKATFKVAVPKGLYNCAIKEDGVVMLDSHILRELMGFEVILNGESSVKQPHIVNTDTADITKAVFAVDYKVDVTPTEEEPKKSPIDTNFNEKKENERQAQEKKKPTPQKDNDGDGYITVNGYKCKPNSTWNGDVYDPTTGKKPKLGDEIPAPKEPLSHMEDNGVLKWTKGIGWGAIDDSVSVDMSDMKF